MTSLAKQIPAVEQQGKRAVKERSEKLERRLLLGPDIILACGGKGSNADPAL